jgi:hypothetical protein
VLVALSTSQHDDCGVVAASARGLIRGTKTGNLPGDAGDESGEADRGRVEEDVALRYWYLAGVHVAQRWVAAG